MLQPQGWPYTAALISFMCLSLAWASEYVFGLVPCPLCYTQRHVYWAAIFAAVLTVVARQFLPKIFVRSGYALLTVIFAVGVFYAAYHAGVEWEIFAPPGGCSGDVAGVQISGQLDLNAQMKLTDCIAAPFRLFGLSMAGWNFGVYFVLCLGSIAAVFNADQAPSSGQ